MRASIAAALHVAIVSLALVVPVVLLAFLATTSWDTLMAFGAFVVAATLVERARPVAAGATLAACAVALGLAEWWSRGLAVTGAATVALIYWRWLLARRRVAGLPARPGLLGLLAWVAGLRIGSWLVPFDPVAALGLLMASVAANRDCFAPLRAYAGLRRATTVATAAAVAIASMAFHRQVGAYRPSASAPREWCVGAPTPPEPGVSRVALLGDSSAYGVLVPEPLALPARLERELARRGRPTEVVVCAVPGAGSDVLAEQLREALAWAPELVVVYVGINDLGREGWETALRERLVGVAAAGRPLVISTYAFGARFTSPAVPALQTTLRDFAAEEGHALADAAAALGTAPWRFVADTVHPNQLGHRRIARVVASGVLAAEAGDNERAVRYTSARSATP